MYTGLRLHIQRVFLVWRATLAMSDNTSALNSTHLKNSTVSDDPMKADFWKNYLLLLSIHNIVLVLTLAAFIYGVISWCILKKFRNFKNYIYLNLLLVNILRLTSISLILHARNVRTIYICVFISSYCTTIYNNWLLVMCYMFYVDIVKVFHIDIKRRYLKSSLFAWGLPFITCLILAYFGLYLSVQPSERKMLLYILVAIIVVTSFLPLLLSLIIYIRLVFSLFRHSDANASRATDTWRRLYIATLMFVLSDVIMLTDFIWNILHISFMIRMVIMYLQIITISLYLPVVRCNRELWREYYVHRLDRNIL